MLTATGKMSFSHKAYSFAEGCKPSFATKLASPFIAFDSSKISTVLRFLRLASPRIIVLNSAMPLPISLPPEYLAPVGVTPKSGIVMMSICFLFDISF